MVKKQSNKQIFKKNNYVTMQTHFETLGMQNVVCAWI